MEGSYNKVFLAKGNIPAESYTFFIDILLDTIRCGGEGFIPCGWGGLTPGVCVSWSLNTSSYPCLNCVIAGHGACLLWTLSMWLCVHSQAWRHHVAQQMEGREVTGVPRQNPQLPSLAQGYQAPPAPLGAGCTNDFTWVCGCDDVGVPLKG